MKVDTNAAREFSNGGDRYTGAEVRLWVHNLADEVDRLRRALGDIAEYAHKPDEVRRWCAEALGA